MQGDRRSGGPLRPDLPRVPVDVRASGVRAKIGARHALAAIVASAVAGLLLWACGGTTGRAGEAPGDTPVVISADATVASNEVDANVTYDTGAFDVAIQYADRTLPDVSAPPEGGTMTEGGPPVCPPWIAVNSAGQPVDIVDPSAYSFVPSDFTADGGIGLAVPGGPCATAHWYSFPEPGFVEWWAMQYAGGAPGSTFAPLPPCSWAIGAGNAQAGTQAGQSRYTLCMQLYECIESSGCWSSIDHITDCLCAVGDAGATCRAGGVAPNGPCGAEELAGFEVPTGQIGPYVYVLNFLLAGYAPSPQAPPYFSTSDLNFVYTREQTRQNLAQINTLQEAAEAADAAY
jgi:hypothetical protein